MKKFPIDLKKFKKVSSDEHVTTLQHEDGHEIKIAHSALSKGLAKQLHELPTAMADGGEAQPEEPGLAYKAGQKLKQGFQDYIHDQGVLMRPIASAAGDFTKGLLGSGEAQASSGLGLNTQPQAPTSQPSVIPQAESTQQQSQGQPQQPQQDMFGNEAFSNQYMKGLGSEEAGIKNAAKAQGELGQQQAQALGQQQEQLNNVQSHFDKENADIQSERAALTHDIQNGHLDFNRVFTNMGTSARIGNAIGLILGGIGSGLTHQPNAVLEMLNGEVERDVAQQKADLGKKENLLTANYHRFGNLKDATDMTRLNIYDATKAQLQALAAKSQNPMAKAYAEQEIGKLDMQSAPLAAQIASRRALLSGGVGNQNPEMVIRAYVPEKEQPTYYKELKDAQNTTRARNNLLAAWDKADKIQSVGNRVGSPIQSESLLKSSVEPSLAILGKEEAGRYTEQDAAAFRPLFPSMTDSASTRAQKRAQFQNMLDAKMDFPMLKSLKIDPMAGSRYNSSGQKTLQLGAPVKK